MSAGHSTESHARRETRHCRARCNEQDTKLRRRRAIVGGNLQTLVWQRPPQGNHHTTRAAPTPHARQGTGERAQHYPRRLETSGMDKARQATQAQAFLQFAQASALAMKLLKTHLRKTWRGEGVLWECWKNLSYRLSDYVWSKCLTINSFKSPASN